MQEKAKIATILLIIALILAGLSLFLPWYNQQFKISGSGLSISFTVDYYLDHAKISGGFISGSSFFGFENLNMSEELYYDDEDTSDSKSIQTFQTTQILAILGLIGCIVGLMGALLVLLRKIPTALGVILVLIAVILALIAPMYIMFALPAAYKEDMGDTASSDSVSTKISENFFGSEEYEYGGTQSTLSWGGSLGWFMALIAMILCVVALFLVIFSRTKPTDFSRSYPGPQISYEKHGFPTAHKEEGWSDYDTYETQEDIETEAPLVFPPFGPKPAGSSLTRRFQCPECEGIVVISVPKRPLDVKCAKCGCSGIVE